MRVTRTLQMALQDLWGHAFRSFLTALGVVFGVGAVVAMMAVSEGNRIVHRQHILERGIDNIVIRSQKPSAGGDASKDKTTSVPSPFGVTRRDIKHIAGNFENLRGLVAVRDTRQAVVVENTKTDIHLLATTPAFLDLSKSRIRPGGGRWLTTMDETNILPVCVIGHEAARKLFAYRDPVGRSVRVRSAHFRVVGVLENIYQARILGDLNLNNQIYIPLRTADAIYSSAMRERQTETYDYVRVEADWIFLRVKDLDQIENTARRLHAYFAATHKDGDYRIDVPYELLKQMEEEERRSLIMLASIAAISLLVGGIGIMNIMMANVYERTREIGTRRAIGAKKRDILLQFLLQAVLLTGLGGLVGVALGFGIAWGISKYTDQTTQVTLFSILLSYPISVGIGVVFGTYPAWKAASLDPITALRTE